MNNQIYYLFLLSFIFLRCSDDSDIKMTCYIEPETDAYNYPIKPGMQEWEELSSSDEMDSVLQIPEDIIKTLSTEGLIETALNYPSWGDIYFLEDNQLAFDVLNENFNGFRELLKRRDAASKLLARYQKMHPGCTKNNYPSIIEPGKNVHFSFAYIEMLIAQYEVLSQLDEEKTNSLMTEILDKYNEKKQYNHSTFSLKTSMLIAGRILYLSNYTSFIERYNTDDFVKDFIEKVWLNNNIETLNIIYEYSNDFLNVK